VTAPTDHPDVPERREILARDTLNELEVVRTSDGWIFVDDEISVPGPTDRTLATVVKPRFIRSSDRGPDEVVVDISAVDEHPDALGWCEGAASSLQTTPDGTVKAYIVPFEAWREHAKKPLGIEAPEFSGSATEVALFRAEHRFRVARRSYETATADRLEALVAAIEDDMARTRAAQLLDISGARVTQLLRTTSEVTTTKGEDNILALAAHLGRRVKTEDVLAARKKGPHSAKEKKAARTALTGLAEKKLLAGSAAEGYELTQAGRDYLGPTDGPTDSETSAEINDSPAIDSGTGSAPMPSGDKGGAESD
jgi:hypothetical protein